MVKPDELENLINNEVHVDWFSGGPRELADAILTAGYRKPRTITGAAELDLLGRGAAVLDATRRVWTNDGDTLDEWGCVHHDEYPQSLVWRGPADIPLPATVLFDPEAAS